MKRYPGDLPPLAALGDSGTALTGALAAGDRHRHREQRRHDPHAGPDQRVQRGASRHHGELGDARGEHPARARDQDIATGGGQYEILTIGNYEVPIWAKQGWLVPLEFDAAYEVDDLLPAIRGA